jgi:hypothetical protein
VSRGESSSAGVAGELASGSRLVLSGGGDEALEFAGCVASGRFEHGLGGVSVRVCVR